MAKPAVNIAIAAARRAGTVIQRSIHRADAIAVTEKSQYDFVTEADKLAEIEIIKEIRKSYPDHAIWGEESGRLGNSRYVWVIDPIDGTSNFMRGFPHCSVSIALMEDGVIQHGVIYDPVRDEIFHASKGSGAYLNDRRIRVSPRQGMPGALIATGFPFRQRARFATQMRMVKALLEDAEDLRRTGSAALDLAYVACGRLDGYFEYGLMPWDMAAGALLGEKHFQAQSPPLGQYRVDPGPYVDADLIEARQVVPIHLRKVHACDDARLEAALLAGILGLQANAH